MNALDLDSFEDIKDITFDLGPSSSNKSSSRPNLITRDPPSRSPTNDSSFGLDLIMNKDKQKRKPSPRSSPSSFSPIPLDEPKSSFSNNMYSKIDNKTPSFGSGNGSGSREKFNMDAYLEDELADLTSKPSITKMGGSHSSSPIELLPPSGNGFNFDDDILGDNSNSNSNQNNQNQNNQNNNQNNYSNSNNNQNSYQQDSYNSASNSNSNDRPMSVEEMQRKKFDLLCKLERLKKKGVIVPRTYTMNSNYEEIKYEYEKLHNERLTDNSVKMYRQMLISTTTAIEYLNAKANPFDFYLDGWSDQVHSQQHDYDEIFEEIYEKYKDRGSMAPELRLLMSLGGSAFMYHLSNTMFKSVLPGAQDILRQNPDLMKHMQQTLLSTMAQQGPAEATFAGMMGGAMNRDTYNPTQGPPTAGMRASNPPSNSNGNRRQMSGPDGLDTFLDDITGGNQRNADL